MSIYILCILYILSWTFLFVCLFVCVSHFLVSWCGVVLSLLLQEIRRRRGGLHGSRGDFSADAGQAGAVQVLASFGPYGCPGGKAECSSSRSLPVGPALSNENLKMKGRDDDTEVYIYTVLCFARATCL